MMMPLVEKGTANPSGAPEVTLGFFVGFMLLNI
jgi:hypothetical protein